MSTSTTIDHAGPLTIYRQMQKAVLTGQAHEATLLPERLLAENAVIETPFAPEGSRRYDGRRAWLSYYQSGGAGLVVNFEGFRELSTHHTDDPNVLVVEYELSGSVIATGVQSSVVCIAVLEVRDGLITHWREYQDIPAITEALTRSAPRG